MNEKWYRNATFIEAAWSDRIPELSGLPKNEGSIFHREGSIPIKPGALIGVDSIRSTTRCGRLP